MGSRHSSVQEMTADCWDGIGSGPGHLMQNSPNCCAWVLQMVCVWHLRLLCMPSRNGVCVCQYILYVFSIVVDAFLFFKMCIFRICRARTSPFSGACQQGRLLYFFACPPTTLPATTYIGKKQVVNNSQHQYRSSVPSHHCISCINLH